MYVLVLNLDLFPKILKLSLAPQINGTVDLMRDCSRCTLFNILAKESSARFVVYVCLLQELQDRAVSSEISVLQVKVVRVLKFLSYKSKLFEFWSFCLTRRRSSCSSSDKLKLSSIISSKFWKTLANCLLVNNTLVVEAHFLNVCLSMLRHVTE